MSQVIRTPFDDHEIGQGFNVDTRERVGTGLVIATVSEDPNVNGQVVRTSFQSVTTRKSRGGARHLGIRRRALRSVFRRREAQLCPEQRGKLLFVLRRRSM